MKKFFKEFKDFISRGNVVDMAVGVIIGGAFSAIVSALTGNILMPVINWVLLAITGGNGLADIVTFLPNGRVVVDGVVDMSKSIYIDWGAFITAIINFILIALVLFLIIKAINTVKEKNEQLKAGLAKGKPTKEEKKEMKAAGVNVKDKAAVKKYLDDKATKEAEEKAKAEAEAKAAEEEAKKHTTEYLLEQIKELLEAKK